MALPDRKFSAGNEYRFGYGGQERDDEINENTYTAEYWEYDSRVARRWNIDPLIKDWESPYAVFANNPVWFADPEGRDSTTYLFSSQTDGKNDYSIEQLQKIADNAKKLDQLNGINYTKYKVFANKEALEASLQKGESSFNPTTDQFFQVDKSAPGGSEEIVFGNTPTSYIARMLVNGNSVQGGYIYGGSLKKYADAIGNSKIAEGELFGFNMALILNHERIAHGYPSAINLMLDVTRGGGAYEGHIAGGIENATPTFYTGSVNKYKLRKVDTYDTRSKNNISILFISGTVLKNIQKNLDDAYFTPKNAKETGTIRGIRGFMKKKLTTTSDD